jgi:hypothetical protein
MGLGTRLAWGAVVLGLVAGAFVVGVLYPDLSRARDRYERADGERQRLQEEFDELDAQLREVFDERESEMNPRQECYQGIARLRREWADLWREVPFDVEPSKGAEYMERASTLVAEAEEHQPVCSEI